MENINEAIMIYRLKAPFISGTAGPLPVIKGEAITDDKKLVEELCNPPFNFKIVDTFDEVAEQMEKQGRILNAQEIIELINGERSERAAGAAAEIEKPEEAIDENLDLSSVEEKSIDPALINSEQPEEAQPITEQAPDPIEAQADAAAPKKAAGKKGNK